MWLLPSTNVWLLLSEQARTWPYGVLESNEVKACRWGSCGWEDTTWVRFPLGSRDQVRVVHVSDQSKTLTGTALAHSTTSIATFMYTAQGTVCDLTSLKAKVRRS